MVGVKYEGDYWLLFFEFLVVYNKIVFDFIPIKD